jgi:SAM-dependent methyltransferase
MDECEFTARDAAACYRFIEHVNRWFGGIAPVRDFLFSEADRQRPSGALRVLDIGSGTCDIPIAVAQHAHRRGIPMHITCVETNADAVKRAENRLARYPSLRLTIIQQDIGKLDVPTDGPFDCAVAAMFCHHLDDDRLCDFLTGLGRLVSGRLLISDLRRSVLAHAGCWLWTRPFPAAVRHDAMLSIRKGFRRDELLRLLTRIPSAHCDDVRLLSVLRIGAVLNYAPRNCRASAAHGRPE